jgi:hypothetical protein
VLGALQENRLTDPIDAQVSKGERMDAPKVFISYSHDSKLHKAWVLKLGSDLRAKGVDVVLDQWDLVPGQDAGLFMERNISEAYRVVMVCSSAYVEKAEGGVGGVGYERLIVTSEIIQSIDTIKFIPILRESGGSNKIPSFLGTRLYIDFDHEDYDEKLDELIRVVHGAPAAIKPPLGPNPFSGFPATPAPARVLDPGGALLGDGKFLDSEWFSQEETNASSGASKLETNGFMELRMGVWHAMSKSQRDLLDAVRQSEIRTFGWPIGILLENREEFRPRPYGDGIRAKVAPAGDPRTSFDYWALRSNGDFYLLQSLFEDQRRPNEIFFDTRIVRVTESLMFAQRLYTNLGVPPEARVGIAVSHKGLAGRTLASASPHRFIISKTATENVSTAEILTILGSMAITRVEDVRKILEPMFMLFDFTQFHERVYDEIVRNFEQGIVR